MGAPSKAHTIQLVKIQVPLQTPQGESEVETLRKYLTLNKECPHESVAG